MNSASSSDPLYAGPRQAVRPQATKTPTPNGNVIAKSNAGPNEPLESNQDRATRYEDEKRRIIESCFSKKEEDGIAAESYIIHVRVVEDGAYPSSAPPPESSSANKKVRVIIVAVKKNGRVRVHKARENQNQTFSIGKTWPMDDLSSIQSYTHLVPRNNQEQMEKQWANGVGFVVTLGKPYYWQAPTPKEKEFFIGSLVKIYRKYTSGKVPELFGFATHEVELMTGAAVTPNPQFSAQTPPPSTQAFSPPPPPPPIPMSSERRPHSPQSFRSQGSDQTGRSRAQSRNEQAPPVRDAQRPPPIEPLRSPLRNEDSQKGRDNRNQHSLDSMNTSRNPEPAPIAPAYLQTTDSHASSSPQSSQQSLAMDRTGTRATNGTTRQPQFPPTRPQRDLSDSIHSADSRPNTGVSDHKSTEPKLEDGFEFIESPPERRKQFVGKPEGYLAPRTGLNSESNSLFTTPAASPSDLTNANAPDQVTGARDMTSQSGKHSDKDYFAQNKNSTSGPVDNPEPPKTMYSVHSQATIAPVDPPNTQGESTTAPKKLEEEHRPGLGPMIKKKSAKDIAGQFRRAALAASAFQPRQGGAGARLKALQDKTSNEPDGITSVVPAPLLRGISSDTVKSSVPATPTTTTTTTTTTTNSEQILPPILNEAATKTRTPPVTANEDVAEPADTPASTQSVTVVSPVEQKQLPVRSPSPEKARSRSPQRKKRQRQEAEISKYCTALGIDPRVIEGRGADFNDLLSEFGWDGKLNKSQRVEDFEAEIKREIGRAQATGWLGHVEQQEGKVQDLSKAFDRAIEECEELDGLFTLYSHELDTLAADIEYIEAQSQGLQVQTANQKLLQNELNSLLKTLTIPSSDLRGLQSGSLDNESGVEAVEKSLSLLYRALITIDPDLRQNKIRHTVSSNADRGGVPVYADTEIGQMRAVRDKKDQYREITSSYVQRFNRQMTTMFKAVDDKSTDDIRQKLWKYNAMMLFVREVNSYEWQTLVTSYEMNLKGIYQTQFREHAMSQRKTVRRPGADELEALFTTQEKEKVDDTLASSAARKLTVKRGRTVKASALRQQLGEKRDGKMDAYEIFQAVLRHQSNVVSEEQNFIVCFFHLNSQSNADFAEIVASKSPNQRRLPNLNAKQSYDPDRNMAKIVQGAIEGIYSFWLSDIQNLLDWTLGIDSLQGVGVLGAIEKCLALYEDTNQEYLIRTLRTIHERLTGLFHKFIDDQIRAIEETKVKVKKRKGVISFVRTFPLFSATIEQMMPVEASPNDVLEVRFIVNDAYGKILKAMWESLNFIAKDDPTVGGVGAHSTAPTGGDPEDKEALNYHILLIENMNHYLEEVDTQNNVVLDEWADRAKQDFNTHLTQYTDSVIRRPLGKWLDFLESTEAMIKNSEAGGLASKPSHSRSTAKKVLSSHDTKEIRKGVETLKKRIEKHFGDLEEPSASSKALVLRVYEECSARYAIAYDRMKAIIDKVYDGSLEIDWRRDEPLAMFKK